MPIRASNIIIIYFVIGAVMFGGGALAYDETGAVQYFIDMDDGNVEPNEETEENLTGVSGAITNLVNTMIGPVILVWNLFVGLIVFLHWPLFTLTGTGAPAAVIVLIGGTLVAMFYMAVIRLVRVSA